jgi:chromosome segregation ATPase
LKAAQEQVATLSAQVRVEQSKTHDAERCRDEALASLKTRREELAKAQTDLGKAYTDLESLRRGLKELLGRVDTALIPAHGRPASVETLSVVIPTVDLK